MFSQNPASASPNPLAFLQNQLGLDIVQQVQEKALNTMSILDDKDKFVQRERMRLQFLEDEKLQTMKNIVQYKEKIDKFPEE